GDGGRNRSAHRWPTCATREGRQGNPPSRLTLTSHVGFDLLFCLASAGCPCADFQGRLAVGRRLLRACSPRNDKPSVIASPSTSLRAAVRKNSLQVEDATGAEPSEIKTASGPRMTT